MAFSWTISSIIQIQTAALSKSKLLPGGSRLVKTGTQPEQRWRALPNCLHGKCKMNQGTFSVWWARL